MAFLTRHDHVIAAVLIRRAAPGSEGAGRIVQHVSRRVKDEPSPHLAQAIPQLDVFSSLESGVETAGSSEEDAAQRAIGGVELALSAAPFAGQHGGILTLELLFLPAHPGGPSPTTKWR